MKITNKRISFAVEKGYFVDADGRVISMRGNIRKEYTGPNGYKAFSIAFEGKSVSIETHRVAAFIKFGSAVFNEGVQVRHINGNKQDNRPDNIEIGSAAENQQDIPQSIRKGRAIRAYMNRGRGSRWKLTVDQIHAARALYSGYPERKPEKGSVSDLAKKFGVGRDAIRLAGTSKMNKLVGVSNG